MEQNVEYVRGNRHTYSFNSSTNKCSSLVQIKVAMLSSTIDIKGPQNKLFQISNHVHTLMVFLSMASSIVRDYYVFGPIIYNISGFCYYS